MSSAAKKAVEKHRPTTYSDPHAVHGGFTRGEGPYQDPRDLIQQEFLKQKAGGSGEYKEMPPDLIKFMKDVGPLKRKDQVEKEKQAEKEKWSRRNMPKHLREEEGQDKKEPHSQSDRRRESMPLMERVEGFDTVRTTSFSYKDDTLDPKDFGAGDVLDIYDLLSRKKRSSIEESMASFYKQHAQNREENWTEEEKNRHQEMLRNTLQYLELPVIMKDTDDSYVGAWPDRVEELKQIKLREMPKTSVKLVLEDLSEPEKDKESSAA